MRVLYCAVGTVHCVCLCQLALQHRADSTNATWRHPLCSANHGERGRWVWWSIIHLRVSNAVRTKGPPVLQKGLSPTQGQSFAGREVSGSIGYLHVWITSSVTHCASTQCDLSNVQAAVTSPYTSMWIDNLMDAMQCSVVQVCHAHVCLLSVTCGWCSSCCCSIHLLPSLTTARECPASNHTASCVHNQTPVV